MDWGLLKADLGPAWNHVPGEIIIFIFEIHYHRGMMGDECEHILNEHICVEKKNMNHAPQKLGCIFSSIHPPCISFGFFHSYKILMENFPQHIFSFDTKWEILSKELKVWHI